MTSYIPRIVDRELERALGVSGAVFIKGPRACGKSATARQVAASEVRLDVDGPEITLARTDPRLILDGDTPRLIDEWQAVPEVWNAVRHTVDDRQGRGQFILTGSATPATDALRHPGAGRVRSLIMRTMTVSERSNEHHASWASLLDGTLESGPGTQATVADYADWIVAGGWPGFRYLDPLDAADEVASYLQEMSEHYYPEIGGMRRDPRRLLSFLRAYAGLVAQPATGAAIRRRIGELSGAEPAPGTVDTLHDFASRLFLVEDQPAWSTKLRSRTALVQMPKRHLADPSLAALLLGATPNHLLTDLETLGILFESQAIHDLRVVAQANRARGVYHFRDTKGRDEIDAVVENRDGSWIGVEVKLSHLHIESAAEHLLATAAKVERPPAALVVIIPTGPVTRLPNGVWVIPLACLGA
ncbi:MAG: ATP-binding protein [Corynebacterium sp.]|uniref:ATP-binding protein n=1 Tax=Corynebacterium sp. TaxID=1720 RepID=UPI0026DF49CB|nr:ATP-binding protein [Corynebacterium sp.]MDO5670679.1 ATP-binding protein [Corynebacterium sp.]